MTLDEYKNELRLLESEFEKRKGRLKIEYAMSNNTVTIGDVFTDHIGSIKVESIKTALYDIPCCVYYGVELSKDGTPNKKNSKRMAWQTNEVKK